MPLTVVLASSVVAPPLILIGGQRSRQTQSEWGAYYRFARLSVSFSCQSIKGLNTG